MHRDRVKPETEELETFVAFGQASEKPLHVEHNKVHTEPRHVQVVQNVKLVLPSVVPHG